MHVDGGRGGKIVRQVHLYFHGTGTKDPAVIRKIKEFELIEQYHWTYEDIDKTSYKRLQELWLIKKQKNEVMQTKANIEKAKRVNAPKKGKFYREV